MGGLLLTICPCDGHVRSASGSDRQTGQMGPCSSVEFGSLCESLSLPGEYGTGRVTADGAGDSGSEQIINLIFHGVGI